MTMHACPAVLFLVFNRPETTVRVFEAIRVAQPSRLYIAADGPRADRLGEADRCKEVRQITTSVDWPCEVRTLFRNDNLGCRRAVSEAISWFFKHEEEGIILEDDCLPHQDFFSWSSAMLTRYRTDPRVMCVTGNNFQSDMTTWPYSYYYSIYNHCWGWASWRRAWALYDADLTMFEPAAAKSLLSKISCFPGFVPAWMNNLEKVRSGFDTWDYQWTWSCWLQGGLTCTPRVNLVSNIGFGPDATHTKSVESAEANLPVVTFPPPYAAPLLVKAAPLFDNEVTSKHFALNNPSLFKRIGKSIQLKWNSVTRKHHAQ